MKKLFFLLGLLTLTSCTQNTAELPTEEAASTSERYVLFTVNTQEFIYSEESAETINRIIDLHEEYDVPVDLYLTEDILRTYEEMAPDLVERLKTSPVVAVSYHSRPPVPYNSSAYDFLGLDQMSEDELYATLLDYQEHATDAETGETTDQDGGYQHVKDVIGYAPVIVGISAEKTITEVLSKIYKDKGAEFIAHGKTDGLGKKLYGLFLRPEDIEVLLSEYAGQEASTFIPALWEEQGASGFMDVKVHDNEFIATKSAWGSIYSKQQPPYDLNRGETKRELLSAEESETFWDLYESCVKYVSEHDSEYQAINALDLQEMTKTL